MLATRTTIANATTAEQRSAQHGIEPELRGSLPRPVFWTARTTQRRALLWNGLAGSLLFGWWNALDFDNATKGLFLWALALVCAATLALCERGWRRQYRLLRHARPIPALVIERKDTGRGDYAVSAVRYTFHLPSGNTAERYFNVTAQHSRALQLQPGDTFTLLQDPRSPNQPLPYLLIDSVTLRGDALALPYKE